MARQALSQQLKASTLIITANIGVETLDAQEAHL